MSRPNSLPTIVKSRRSRVAMRFPCASAHAATAASANPSGRFAYFRGPAAYRAFKARYRTRQNPCELLPQYSRQSAYFVYAPSALFKFATGKKTFFRPGNFEIRLSRLTGEKGKSSSGNFKLAQSETGAYQRVPLWLCGYCNPNKRAGFSFDMRASSLSLNPL